MNGDFTHKRLLIQNDRTGDKKTVIVKLGTTYRPPSGYKIVTECGRMCLTKKNEGLK
jgi:hypothetical protein